MTLETRITRLERKAPSPVDKVTAILHQIIRPDGSTEGYLLDTPAGYVDLSPNDPLLAGMPPITAEVNGGYRLEDRP